MQSTFLWNIRKSCSCVASGLFRAFTLSLLIVVFGFISLQGQTAYVANSGNNTVSAIDTVTNTVTATIPLASPPYAVVASPDGARIYVADQIINVFTQVFSSTAIYVIDPSTNTVVRTIPVPNTDFLQGLAITPDGKTLYATDGLSDTVYVIDAASGSFTATIPGAGNGALVVSPDGNAVYAASSSGQISVINTATNTVTSTISTGEGSFPGYYETALTPNGSFLYVPLGNLNEVAVIATATNTVTSLVQIDQGVVSVAISPDGALAYVTGPAQGSVTAIAVSTNTVVATIPTSCGNVFFLTFTPDSAFAYASEMGGAVDVISTATNTIVATIPLAGPAGIAIVRPLETPTAVAGPNQTVTVQQTVHLDGSGSFAPNTLPGNLQYAWSFVSQPIGSTAVLNGANTITPSFVADVPGTFVVQLVVTDPATTLSSTASQVTISSVWSPPIANAGANQSVTTGSVVQLNGTGSSDPNGLPLAYRWSFTDKPGGSAATITPGTPGLASFIADVAGIYTVQLVVSDQVGSSEPSTVVITATTPENAQQRIQGAINYIAAMPTSHFDAQGHRNALSKQLQAAIADIQAGKTSQAIGKLNNAIIRTDGFPLRGSADGAGPGMDWITNQNDQTFLYQAITAALSLM